MQSIVSRTLHQPEAPAYDEKSGAKPEQNETAALGRAGEPSGHSR